MDFMLVCLSLWVELTHKHTHTHITRATRATHTRGWALKMDLYVSLEVMMRDGSWHVSGTR